MSGHEDPRTTLTDFLLARIAEDEERADRVEFRPYVGEGTPESMESRVLAECEAKRRIVAVESGERAKRDAPDHRRAWEDGRVTISFWESGMLRTLTDEARDAFIAEWYEPAPPSHVLRLLALPYAYHPDYREDWRA